MIMRVRTDTAFGSSSLRVTSMIALLASAIQARAQEGPAVAADEAVDGGIGEIVVTAQKRDQSVQDVGITMSVLSSEGLCCKHGARPRGVTQLGD